MHIYILCPYWVISWHYVKGLSEEFQLKGKDQSQMDRQVTNIIPSPTDCVRYKNMVRIACHLWASTSLTIFCDRKYN